MREAAMITHAHAARPSEKDQCGTNQNGLPTEKERCDQCQRMDQNDPNDDRPIEAASDQFRCTCPFRHLAMCSIKSQALSILTNWCVRVVRHWELGIFAAALALRRGQQRNRLLVVHLSRFHKKIGQPQCCRMDLLISSINPPEAIKYRRNETT